MKFAALLAGLLVLGGCEPTTPETAHGADTPGPGAKVPGGPFAISLAVRGQEKILVLGGPNGRAAAASLDGAQEGKLMDVKLAQARFAGLLPKEALSDPEVVIKLPAFSLEVDGEDGPGGDGAAERGDAPGRVKVRIGSGGQAISIDAQDGEQPGSEDNAVIRIDGADEKALRDFLLEQEGISDKLRMALLSELGLE